jgi:hypothetical protein
MNFSYLRRAIATKYFVPKFTSTVPKSPRGGVQLEKQRSFTYDGPCWFQVVLACVRVVPPSFGRVTWLLLEGACAVSQIASGAARYRRLFDVFLVLPFWAPSWELDDSLLAQQ